MTNKAFAVLSADAGVLIANISKQQKGDTITYEDIENWISWDIRENRGIMTTVKNRLLRDYSMVLDAVPTVGYRILTDAETVDGRLRGDRDTRRRSAQRSKLKAASVDIATLNDTQRVSYLAELTAAHVTIEASSDKSQKQLATTLNGSTTPLALNNALEAIKHNLK